MAKMSSQSQSSTSKIFFTTSPKLNCVPPRSFYSRPVKHLNHPSLELTVFTFGAKNKKMISEGLKPPDTCSHDYEKVAFSAAQQTVNEVLPLGYILKHRSLKPELFAFRVVQNVRNASRPLETSL
jgi:hypothetical protein